MNDERTQIPVSKKVRQLVRDCGNKGMTYDEILLKLIQNQKQEAKE